MVHRQQTSQRGWARLAVLVLPAALILGAAAAMAEDPAAGDLPLDTRILTRGETAPSAPLPVPTSAGPVTGPIPFLEPDQPAIPSLPGLVDEPAPAYDADVVVRGAGFADPNVKAKAVPGMAPGDMVGLIVGDGFRIRFSPGTEEIGTEAGDLLSGLVEKLAADGTSQIEIRAYAGAKPDPANARRLSLSRALNIRSFLIDRGIDSKRIALRALGNTSPPDQPADRVDLRIQ
ncbi:OmpA family protein [Inquilinus sp. OTU3971]|uniref:OmpA family protein n=1 Tax=Inquilinus sp. OTU3971 TaxID=3043855 RepID=UPI00313C912A